MEDTDPKRMSDVDLAVIEKFAAEDGHITKAGILKLVAEVKRLRAIVDRVPDTLREYVEDPSTDFRTSAKDDL